MFESESPEAEQQAFTGELPTHSATARILAEAHPAWFGLSFIDTTGQCHEGGDVDVGFSIQWISKAFVFALACQARSHEFVHERIGVNNAGLPFNSVMAIELNDGHPMNSMVNAGAIAITALVTGETPAEKRETIRTGLSRFAGRSLELNGGVYRFEIETNQRNKALARLLESYGRIITDPLDTVEIYTRQCSLSVTAHDLAVMGATLADGGLNPVTRERVVSAEVARDTLALLASCGMYETSGEWLFEIGLPANSGVAGGIVAIAPARARSEPSLPVSIPPVTVSAANEPATTSRGLLASTSSLRTPTHHLTDRIASLV